MARTRTPAEQQALENFLTAPTGDDAAAVVTETPSSPDAPPAAPAAPATDGAPIVVVDTPAPKSWRDDVIGEAEEVHPIWRGRKRGEYADAVAQSAKSNAEAATAAQRENERLRGELDAVREGRLVAPPKPEKPAEPVKLPFGVTTEDEYYAQLPKIVQDIHDQNTALRAELDELKGSARDREFREVSVICDNAHAYARTLVAPTATAEQWNEFKRPVGIFMATQNPPLDPSNPQAWAWAARTMKLDRILAPSASGPIITAPVVQRHAGAPPVGNSAPSAPLHAGATDDKKTTGSAEIDAAADEVASIANRRAEREGRPKMNADAIREQFLRNRGGRR